MTRRKFLLMTGAAAMMAKLHGGEAAASPTAEIPRRKLGRTGEEVSMVGIGGYHIGVPGDAQDGVRIIRTAIDSGINFLDNSWDYHDGESEKRMGQALRDGYRQKVFLMTKADGRNKQTAAKQLDESLRRLQTDHLDLWQFHEIIRDSDPDRVFAPGGAIEAALEARKAGKIRYIGFTGHKSPAIHLKMLTTAFAHGFTFDTVQMPLNVMDAHFESFQTRVLPVLLQHNIGVLGMKPMGAGIILNSGAVTPVECLQYAMSLPTSVVITGCDSMRILQQAVNLARNFQPLSKEQVAALLDKTVAYAKAGKYEGYKSSNQFDSTFHNPQWLG